jgi:hypothetical protein
MNTPSRIFVVFTPGNCCAKAGADHSDTHSAINANLSVRFTMFPLGWEGIAAGRLGSCTSLPSGRSRLEVTEKAF